MWAPSRALGRAVLLAGLFVLAGVLLGRVDLVVLGAPFALGTAVALHRRPRGGPGVHLVADDTGLAESGSVTATLAVDNRDDADYDLVVTRTRVSPWLRLAHADRPRAAAARRGDSEDVVTLTGEAIRWGLH
ncbi:MAG TPA: DUF58 domain-containing protein, partial [Pilimelia sp.]|nr:DUF58 domain-containing protein [Pilimelia sp.]